MRRGFTLAEVGVSIILVAVAVWSMQVLYVGLLRGTRKGDDNRPALAALDSLVANFRHQTQVNWPTTQPPDTTSLILGTLGEYQYQVTDSGRVQDPLNTSGGTPVYLQLKKLHLDLSFYGQDATGVQSLKTMGVDFCVTR